MALSASDMVTLIDETIQERLGGPKRFRDGPDELEHHSLEQLMKLRSSYAEIAAQDAAGSGCEAFYVSGSIYDGQ
jgi:hypothetical protein